MQKTLKAPKNYLSETVLYTLVSLLMNAYLLLGPLAGDHDGLEHVFTLLAAFVFMIASGVAALVAAGMTIYSPFISRDRRVACVCIAVLVVAAVAFLIIFSNS